MSHTVFLKAGWHSLLWSEPAMSHKNVLLWCISCLHLDTVCVWSVKLLCNVIYMQVNCQNLTSDDEQLKDATLQGV